MKKIIFTLIVVFLFQVAPLLGNPNLLTHWKIILIIFTASIVWLSQPALRSEEVKANQKTDNHTTWLILAMVALSTILPELEWAYFKTSKDGTPAGNIAGLLFISGGIAIRLWAIRTLGRHFTATVQTSSEQPLGDEAFQIIQQAKQHAESSFGTQHLSYARVLFYEGKTFQYLEKMEEAALSYEKAIEIKDSSWLSHPEYAKCMHNLGNIYSNKGKYDLAESYYQQAQSMQEKAIGKEHPDYLANINDYANLFIRRGNLKRAEQLLLEIISIYEKTVGKENLGYIRSATSLSVVYRYAGRFIEAEKILLESISIWQKSFDTADQAYSTLLHYLTTLNYEMGRIAEAVEYCKEAIAIIEKAKGKSNQLYISYLTTLAGLYASTESFEAAERIYLEAKSAQEKLTGEAFPNYAVILHNLALTYYRMGQYELAESIISKALTIRKKILGQEHYLYATSLELLSNIYIKKNLFETAEPLQREANAITKKVFGENSLNYATGVSSIAYIYHSMGNFEKAEQLYLFAKSIREKKTGKEHPQYISSLNDLGTLYVEIGRLEEANLLLTEAIGIQEKIGGKEHSRYASYLMNLAILNKFRNQLEKTESLYLEAKEIIERTIGKEHPTYALCLHNLGLLYKDTRNYENADSLFRIAKMINEKVLGKTNEYYLGNLFNLALINWKTGRLDKSVHLFKESLDLVAKIMLNSSTHLSESELTSFMKKNISYVDCLLSFINDNPGVSNDLSNYSWGNAMLYKGFLIENIAKLEKDIVTAPDSLRIMHSTWRSLHRRLAAQYARPIAERDSTLIASIEEQANTLEKELVRTVAGFGEARRQVSWQEVQDNLQAGEAAIEFVHYQYFNPEATDSVLYSALVLRPGWEAPRMVYLCEQRQLDSLLQGTDAGATVGQIYASRGITPGNKTGSDQLYQLLWQPLDSLLGGVNTVYFSPSGLLHRVAFHAIPTPNKNEVLADRYKLFQLFSTRSLAVKTTDTTLPTSATLFGGIRYDVEAATPSSSDSLDAWAAVPFSSSLLPSTRSRRGEGWQYLPGTAQEVERLQRLFQQQHIQSATWTDTLASEERFKSLGATAASPAILHLATHGFFFPDPKLDKNRLHGLEGSSIPLSENPLMRSGLLLAGANQAWKEGKPLPGKEDGILTAYEIAQVNLSGTQLAVLSACETGLGDIQASEGVMGLQRAFKMAGVEKLIVSLWQVPDKQTAVFMESFYVNWLSKGSSIRVAFYDTQRQMRKQYKDPFVWAGFVLVE
ncbi:MAG: CHAT domain-containing protein [Saprospiraceae bacterium]|nr:CHAT domain-containing protein [Saprospiraceae bacterium]